jgi:pentatricopeptide repeat protein
VPDCSKGGQWQQALQLLSVMPKAGLLPNEITYNSAISACEKGEQWQLALNLLSVMPERSCWDAAAGMLSECSCWDAAVGALF